jgi:hypothetical protein
VFVSIRRYETDPGMAGQIVQEVKSRFEPMIARSPGFIAYYIVDSRNGVITSISVFSSRAEAVESNRMAADFIRQNIPHLLPNAPEVTEGDVVEYHVRSGGPSIGMM